MAVNFKINSVTLNSNDQLQFDDSGITVIVGPNNAGKSCFLREVFQTLQNGHQQTDRSRKIIKKIEFKGEGSDKEFNEFISNRTKLYTRADGQIFMQALNVNIQEHIAHQKWKNRDNGLHEITNLICTFGDTLNRLTMVNPPNSINILMESPQHPIQSMYENEEIEKKINKHFKLAFGEDLILNRGAGSILPLHLGIQPEIPQGDRISKNYLKELAKLPLVHEQGDGIKSFVGCLLTIIGMEKFIKLLDEPEGSLHPPQARQIGNLLAKEHMSNQMIIATHSGDVLRGMLDANPAKLNILRITREKNQNFIFKLDTDDLKKFWSDPILRFSNILDGLFHDAIIIGESDIDCRFYSAMMTSLYDGTDGNDPTKQPDFFFTSSGGKNRIASILKALVKIKMKTRVIADFDLLFEIERTKEIFELLGGLWNEIETDFNIVHNAIQKKIQSQTANEFCEKISNILSKIKSQNIVDNSHLIEMKKIINSSSFKLAKKHGINILTESQDKDACKNIIKKFKEIGLWLVPYGELESFDTSVEGHGQKWVARVLEKNLASAVELQDAREFMAELAQS